METLTKNKLISDYLQQFDKEEWPNVIEHLLALAITTINENNQKIKQYQLICNHEYENGKCKYCGKEKG